MSNPHAEPAEFVAAVAARLSTKWLGREHRRLAITASTNDDASAWARQGAVHGAIVSARQQSQGRGRLGRVWSGAPSDDLYVSLIIRPEPAAQLELGAFGLAIAVGLREGLIKVLPPPLAAQVAIKWPNDILLAERKVAGILCECRWGERGPEIVAGFGINVERCDFPEELRERATSLRLLAGAAPAVDTVSTLAAVLNALEDAIDAFLHGGFAAIRRRYEPYCRELGHAIRLVEGNPQEARECMAVALDRDGALLVRHTNEVGLQRVHSADVWLRASPCGLDECP